MEKKEESLERIRQDILSVLTFEGNMTDEEIIERIEECVLNAGQKRYLTFEQKEELIRSVYNAVRKLDILQELLEDKSITEIMVNGSAHIFVEREGRIEPYSKSFYNSSKLEDVIQQIVGKVNRRVNEANPIADVRLEDGSRVNVVLPPVSLDGPTVTIRKFPEIPMSMTRLLEFGALSKEIAEVLRVLVEAKYNIFISGGTGSGKTSFLNSMAAFIPADERIITIEDSAELQIRNIPNLVRLEVRNANVEGKNEITIRDLMISALRMRPDRIILGEVRDAAACELLSVMNTGHDGSLCTGHANSPQDMLNRLETLVLTGMDIPLMAVRNQIASAIDIIVQLGRLRDKSRKLLQISEVEGVEDGKIKLRELYTFCETGETEGGTVTGAWKRSEKGLLHRQKLRAAGKRIPVLE